jgi:predicted enzyme related to lactoylglutathione lyase
VQALSNTTNLLHLKEKFMSKKVTGVGGIFFKCDDPDKMRNWYGDNLGLVTNEYGALFEFRNTHEPDKINYLQWSTFSKDSNYMEPSKKDFMINYRVENLVELEIDLRASGVTICDKIEEFDYGKFLHIMDPEGNKIELWEPIDKVFTPDEEGKTTC